MGRRGKPQRRLEVPLEVPLEVLVRESSGQSTPAPVQQAPKKYICLHMIAASCAIMHCTMAEQQAHLHRTDKFAENTKNCSLCQHKAIQLNLVIMHVTSAYDLAG